MDIQFLEDEKERKKERGEQHILYSLHPSPRLFFLSKKF